MGGGGREVGWREVQSQMRGCPRRVNGWEGGEALVEKKQGSDLGVGQIWREVVTQGRG